MAFLVERPVDGLVTCPAWVLFDLCDRPEFVGDKGPQSVGVVAGVRDHMPHALQPGDQPLGLRPVAPMARGDLEPDRQAKSIDSGMDLGRQPPARATDRVSFSPPFAPLASACALQIVASTNTYSKSGSCDKALKRLSHIPASVQRRNRQCTVRQFPSCSGKSRQGDAVRASHRTASTKRRLSVPVRPRSPFLPETSGSIRAHCASLNVRLLKIASVFDLESNLRKFGNPLNEDAA